MNLLYKIRFAEPKDIAQVVALAKAHALYEKAEITPSPKAEQLAIDLFSDTPKLYCLVVETGKQLIGYASYMKQYSTWEANEYIYMDCLFLHDSARGQGIGTQLINRIQQEGSALGCNLVQWQTPSFNVRAIKFYKRMGAISKSKERFFLDTQNV